MSAASLDASRLHADDAHRGIEGLDGECNASDETTAANGHDYRVRVLYLLQHLHPKCPCACDDFGIVVAVDVRRMRVTLLRVPLGVANVRSLDDNVGAKVTALFHLGHGRHGWHDHCHWNPEFRAMDTGRVGKRKHTQKNEVPVECVRAGTVRAGSMRQDDVSRRAAAEA